MFCIADKFLYYSFQYFTPFEKLEDPAMIGIIFNQVKYFIVLYAVN